MTFVFSPLVHQQNFGVLKYKHFMHRILRRLKMTLCINMALCYSLWLYWLFIHTAVF